MDAANHGYEATVGDGDVGAHIVRDMKRPVETRREDRARSGVFFKPFCLKIY
jgi:hypothetical protein